MQKRAMGLCKRVLCLLLLSACGDSSTASENSTSELASVNVTPMLSVSSTSACALKANGKPTCKGKASTGLVPGRTYSHIAVSDDTFCGLRTGGLITSAGSITCNGNKTVENSKPSGGGFVSIFAGKRHFCATKPDNSFVCWGPVCQNEQSCWYQESQRNLFARHTQGKPVLGTSWQRVEFKGPIRNMAVGDDLTCYVPRVGIDSKESRIGGVNTVQCFGNVSGDGRISLGKGVGVRSLSVGSSSLCLLGQTAATAENKTSDSAKTVMQCYHRNDPSSDFQTNENIKRRLPTIEDVVGAAQVKHGELGGNAGGCLRDSSTWSCSLTNFARFSGEFDISYNANLYCKWIKSPTFFNKNATKIQCDGAAAARNKILIEWTP